MTLVIDPHPKSDALPAFRAKADIVALSSPSLPELSYVSGLQGTPLIIDTPGEYSAAGLTLYGIAWYGTDGSEHFFQRWHIENLVIVHLGAIDRSLTDGELQQLEQTDIDVLLLPIVARSRWTLREALAALTVIEPRIVIPINFTSSKDFSKQMGVPAVVPQARAVLSRRNLPAEGLETIILQT